MRPVDSVTRALLFVACALHAPARSATLTELAQHSGVAHDVARRRLDNLRRAGRLSIARGREVAYRNRPVAEYAPPVAAPARNCALEGVMRAWAVH